MIAAPWIRPAPWAGDWRCVAAQPVEHPLTGPAVLTAWWLWSGEGDAGRIAVTVEPLCYNKLLPGYPTRLPVLLFDTPDPHPGDGENPDEIARALDHGWCEVNRDARAFWCCP